MKNDFSIILRGDPVAQQRARIFKRGNRICSFDPQTLYKKGLKDLVRNAVDDYIYDFGRYEMPKFPEISFYFFMPIPKSMSKKDKAKASTDTWKHVKKPDVDNLIKLYLDVLTGIAIEDDNCVSIGSAIKCYSDFPRTSILIKEKQEFVDGK